MKQFIISVSREFGSAGHEIADRLAKRYGLPLYDHNLLKEVASEKNLDSNALAEFDERQRNKLLYRSVNGMNSSPSENVFQMQFDFLKQKADSGESFVVVGRCSESVLKPYEGLIPIFIMGDMPQKTERIMKLYQKSEKDAVALIKEKDKRRRKYHNSHCKEKWGDPRNYGICLNSSPLGVDESVKLLSAYIDVVRKGREG